MLTNDEKLFLKVYAASGCMDVIEALQGSGLTSADYQRATSSPEFQRDLYALFASLENAPPPAPFDFAPPAPITASFGSFGVSIDIYGPLLGSYAYDHISHAFCNGVKMSQLQPSEVIWLNAAASWKSADAAIAAARP